MLGPPLGSEAPREVPRECPAVCSSDQWFGFKKAGAGTRGIVQRGGHLLYTGQAPVWSLASHVVHKTSQECLSAEF